MASRSHTTFQKRQKEILRMEKQRDKAAKRQERKLTPKDGGGPPIGDPMERFGDLETFGENEAPQLR